MGMVAPIFSEDSMAEYYLPEGIWTNYLTGEEREGGKWYREKHGYLSIPLYVKEGSIVANGAHNENAVYDYADGVTFRVYRVKDGQTLNSFVYDENAGAASQVSVTRNGNTCRIKVTAGKPCTVKLMNVTQPVKAADAERELPYQMEDGKHLTISFAGSGEAEILF